MAISEVDIDDLYSAVTSVPQATGYFDRVNQHEPTQAPGRGLTCGTWLDRIEPALSSGLASTTGLFVFSVRLYTSAFHPDPDQMDPWLTKANNAVFGSYIGNVGLDLSFVRNIDVRGMTQERLVSRAGYITMAGPGDSKRVYRIYTITVPVIVNDAWDEGA